MSHHQPEKMSQEPPMYPQSYQLHTYTPPGQFDTQQQNLLPPQAAEVQRQDIPDAPKKKDDDEISNKGEGDPCYIPDSALNLEFDACFNEHKSTKTFVQLYQVVGLVYKFIKLVVYHIFVILIGIPMAILWAILNGIFVFIVTWMYWPVLKITIMWVYAVTPLVTVPIQAILTPLADVTARVFRQIRIKATLSGSVADSLRLVGHEHTV